MTGALPSWPDPAGPLARDDCRRDWIWDRRVETATPDEQLAMANEAWHRLASDLESRSEFYRDKNAAAGVRAGDVPSVTDLHRLPFTSKDELRLSQEVAPPFGTHLGVDPKMVKLLYQTSGSSGRPNLLALTAADSETWTTIGARSYYTTGLHPHHSVLTTFGAGPFVAGQTHRTLDRIGARRVPVGPGDTARVMSALELGLIDTLLATPSYAIYLATLFDERGIDGSSLGVRHLIVGGEPGGGIPAVRQRVESSFGADVTEAGGIGDISASLYGECPMKSGMHFGATGLVWAELIDPSSGAPIGIEKGAEGEIVYTTLVREAMPMVRFRSGDIAHVTDTSCGCGRTSFKIRIVGRSDDMFIVRGVNVFPSAIQAVVADFEPAVTGRIRVVVPDNGSVSIDPPIPVEVEVPSAENFDPSLQSSIEAAIRSRLVFRATVTFVHQDEFGDAGYKTRPIVRR